MIEKLDEWQSEALRIGSVLLASDGELKWRNEEGPWSSGNALCDFFCQTESEMLCGVDDAITRSILKLSE